MNYTENRTPRRLDGNRYRRGSRVGASLPSIAAFSAVFLLAGLGIALVGLEVIPVDPSTVHAPYWVLVAMGALFAGCGLFLLGMGLREHRVEHRRTANAARHPGNPAHADYPWEPGCFADSSGKDVSRALSAATLVTLLLVPLNAVFLADKHAPWFVYIVLGFFDLVGVWVGIHAFLLLGRWLKFGRSRIEVASIPVDRSRPVTIRWFPPAGLRAVAAGQFTLRCVREWYETTGAGDSRSTHLVHEEQWSGTWDLGAQNALEPDLPGSGQLSPIEVRFEIPPHLPGTSLRADQPVFWELEVQVSLPGIDLNASYMVPVY